MNEIRFNVLLKAGCKNLVEKLNAELQMTQKEAEDACNMFENQIKAILSTANAFGNSLTLFFIYRLKLFTRR